MECTRFVKEYNLDIDKDAIFTEDMPVKWVSTWASGDKDKFDLRFTFLKADAGVNLHSVSALVDVQGYYWVTDDTGYRHNSWYPVEDGNRSVKWSEVKKEVTFSFSTKPSANLEPISLHAFRKEIKITFTLIIPKLRAIPISGYCFTEENEVNDKILVVGEKKFYVNKAILSQYSSFFNTLFSTTHFEEAGKEEIDLKDLNPEEFKTLLHVIHPTNTVVDVNNVEFLWKLSDRFGIASVAQMCESFICNLEGKQSGAFSVSNRLKMAELYNSEKLKTIVMEMIDKM